MQSKGEGIKNIQNTALSSKINLHHLPLPLTFLLQIQVRAHLWVKLTIPPRTRCLRITQNPLQFAKNIEQVSLPLAQKPKIAGVPRTETPTQIAKNRNTLRRSAGKTEIDKPIEVETTASKIEEKWDCHLPRKKPITERSIEKMQRPSLVVSSI